MYTLYLFIVCFLSILTAHTLLNRTKTIKYSVVVFVLITLFTFATGILVEKNIKNQIAVEYILAFIGFFYIAYFELIFSESTSKKIFTLLSIWIFYRITFYFLNTFGELFSVIFNIKYNKYLIYVFTNCIQIILLLVTCFSLSKYYKKILSTVSDRILNFMSLYLVIAFLLLKTTSFLQFQNTSSIYAILLLLTFIIWGYVLVFAGISSASQIISLKYSMEKLEWVSNTDTLTGLYNRRCIMKKLEEELIRNNGRKNSFSIIIGDIDYFKKINDTFGHDCGDYVLKVVSKSLQDAVRERDVVSRWGGEEFLILLPETASEGACKLADRMRKILEEQIIEYNGYKVKITMTFGVTSVNDNYGKVEDIIKKADCALYEGKRRGRNCIVLAPLPPSSSSRSRHDLNA
ncbi:GGDEF domain-containing protein [Desulfosporosinus sp. FKA]|uniref:GGDEF domain-containing protein n=1 Tax=Desulfosporosinus sp. FKA TaxID=1969834 RepID=UPI000B49C23A|nr:GGDEF domain-containing protein [Desulfosporosinus sp. FKA]